MSKKKQPEPPIMAEVAPVESLPPEPPPSAPVFVKHPWTGDGARAKGLKCPRCHCPQFRDGTNVRNTLRVEGAVRRYRVCRNCGTHWTTLEQ